MSLPVSVCIPVRNEEANLPDCLASVSAFPEVVVVDSRSSDGTVGIAEQAGAQVLQFDWNGYSPKKRTWTLRQHAFKHPWVLFLDADERVVPEFVTELESTLPRTSHAGFWISFVNTFMGRDLRHGDSLRKLALFRIGCGEYERFPEERWSRLDMEVHEHPILNGTTGRIRTRLRHHGRGPMESIERHKEYSSWEAQRFLLLQGAEATKSWEALNERQRFKYRNLDRFWLAYFYFLFQYFIKRGFLDGRAGLRFACLKFLYLSDVRRKITEGRRRRPDSTSGSDPQTNAYKPDITATP
jgi:glycosyltransferase involved in cell wall biosynthesis